ncbi:MAG TPA: hypothetical protein VEB19_02830 [Gemmatimonadaceae bacterium]|nr:hypothetical protein [Gemmatimonadaceae bacterium]
MRRIVLLALVGAACGEVDLVAPPANVPPTFSAQLSTNQDAELRTSLTAFFDAGSDAEGYDRALLDSAVLLDGVETFREGRTQGQIFYFLSATLTEAPFPAAAAVRGPIPEGSSGVAPSMSVPRALRVDPFEIEVVEGTTVGLNVVALPDTVGELVGRFGFWTLLIQGESVPTLNLDAPRSVPARFEIPWSLLGNAVKAGTVLTATLNTNRQYELLNAPYRTFVSTSSSLTWKITVVAPSP